MTTVWQKELVLQGSAWSQVLKDSETLRLMESVAPDLVAFLEEDGDDTLSRFSAGMRLVVDQVARLDTELFRVWGRDGLFRWLTVFLAQGIDHQTGTTHYADLVTDIAPPGPRALYGNPLPVTMPGDWVNRITDEHHRQHRDFLRSYRPAKPEGRPRGKPAAKASRRLDPDVVAKAKELSAQGLEIHSISRRLWPELDLTDRRQREAARKRVERLLQHASKRSRTFKTGT